MEAEKGKAKRSLSLTVSEEKSRCVFKGERRGWLRYKNREGREWEACLGLGGNTKEFPGRRVPVLIVGVSKLVGLFCLPFGKTGNRLEGREER